MRARRRPCQSSDQSRTNGRNDLRTLIGQYQLYSIGADFGRIPLRDLTPSCPQERFFRIAGMDATSGGASRGAYWPARAAGWPPPGRSHSGNRPPAVQGRPAAWTMPARPAPGRLDG
jgi:hypothetical protein